MKNNILLFISKTAFCLFWVAVCMLNSKDFTATMGWLITAVICGVWLGALLYANCFWKGASKDV